MITNLWSTPRTGSIWYSHWLQQQQPASLLLTEPFNRNHMDMYHFLDDRGSIINYHHPISGGFYTEYFLDSKNFLNKRKVYDNRIRTPREEELYIYGLLKSRNPDQLLIIHNHVDPLNEEIRDYLLDSADKHIWLYRRDKKRQLASYAIAISTKKFAAFKKPDIFNEKLEKIKDCNLEALQSLIRRIILWHSFYKTSPNSEVVAFEDISFFEEDGLPYDQNFDPWTRLTEGVQDIINQLIDEHQL